MQVWDTNSGQCTATMSHSDDVAVLCCDFSLDSSRLITGDTSGSVKVKVLLRTYVAICRVSIAYSACYIAILYS